jgi:ABC-type branched-subunit amino acid transport system ATPase component
MKITVTGLRAAFSGNEVVKGIDLTVTSRQITAIIGPVGLRQVDLPPLA